MARDILQKVAERFDRKELTRFFRAANDNFVQQITPLRGYDSEHFADFSVLGEMELESHRKLVTLAAKVSGNLNEYSSRKAQFDTMRKILGDRYPGHWGAICIFHGETGAFRFSLIHRQYDDDDARVTFNPFRRFTYFIHPNEPNRTFLERIGSADFSSSKQIKEAFSVQKVTEEFFDDYLEVFDDLQSRLFKSSKDKAWAHDYALQILNRLMFLYFIQKKRWLGDNPQFIRCFWESYKKSRQPRDSFFRKWVSILFFEAFNGQFKAGRDDRSYLPEDLRHILATAPYLNGGLFTRSELDEKYPADLPDEFFERLFDFYKGSTPGFFERYNFTITEATPFDVDVAVDPEMIGKVYEQLVNITFEGISEEDRRGGGGIFYTERVEIDLMCRLSLADCLTNYMGLKHKPLLYDAVFAHDQEEKEKTDKALTKNNLWRDLGRILKELTVCDPACGSGSFLIGMLMVLDDLQSRANVQLGEEETAYRRRRRIIGNQLYGVDVMDWAVHVAELRLWLQLAIETDLKPEELTLQPLLPNLSFNVRCGDSLVQEVGGFNLGLRRAPFDIPSEIQGRITALQGKKRSFYQGAQNIKKSDLEKEERNIFIALLKSKRHALNNEIKMLSQRKEKEEGQEGLAGFGDAQSKSKKDISKTEGGIERKREDLDEVEKALETFSRVEVTPFVWDIAFVEIFKGEKKGFDIVIGNPPYVRQEKIAWPGDDPERYGGENSDRWKERKKKYKEKLQRSIALAWPRFFNYHKVKGTFEKTDAKRDLYIYFYFHGLSLLHKKGSFCFITSNSWLDVGYGADLQEFLLRHSHVKFILDNERKRSFAQADVNTIIALLSPPDDRKEAGLDKTARFVMFKVPFEGILNAETFKMLENVTEDRRNIEAWRICCKPHLELLNEGEVTGKEREEGDDDIISNLKTTHLKASKYMANKWGGKYLRAPEIFFTILEKGKEKLVRIDDLATVRRGFTTGADIWFYMTREQARELGIEKRFLRPILTDPGDQNVPGIVVTNQNADLFVIDVHEDKSKLRGTGLLKWIERGEKEEFKGRGKEKSIPAKRPSVSSRKLWFELPTREPAPVLWIEVKKRRNLTLLNQGRLLADRSFYDIIPNRVEPRDLCALLNNTVTSLFCEIQGNAPGGSGAGVQMTCLEVRRLPVLNPKLLTNHQRECLLEAFKTICQRPIGPVYDEVMRADRQALDNVVFDVLGLTASEREAVYEAVVNLVRARLDKAKSI